MQFPIIDYKNYLSLLRYCVSDNKQCIPSCISSINWDDLLEFAQKQSILGIYANELVKNNTFLMANGWFGNKPSEISLMKWYGYSNIIEKRNQQVNKRAVETSKQFEGGGFDTCILKGQGNAAYYPNPLSRASGDIDIWVMPKTTNSHDDKMEQVAKFVMKTNKPESMNKYHVEYQYEGVSIEAHSIPAKFYSPVSNKALQEYFTSREKRLSKNRIPLDQNGGTINVPTADFNIVYQLLHSYKHPLSEGIGLRHVIDYFYLLKNVVWVDTTDYKNMWQANKDEALGYIKRFGCYKFASALAYILHDVLGLEKEHMLVEPNNAEGEFLLHEILEGGNFGKYDDRVNAIHNKENHLNRYLSRIWFKMRLIRHYPQWALMEPITYAIDFYESIKYRKLLTKWIVE